MERLPSSKQRRLFGGIWGPLLFGVAFFAALWTAYGLYIRPHHVRSYGQEMPFEKAMFGKDLEQPIPFSHRLHVTDKQIDCHYCHTTAERSANAGMPSIEKCLGCHNYIIPEHQEILKLKAYSKKGQDLSWTRVYYNPDHVIFPHFRHLNKGVQCQECHGEVEKVDRLKKVTFYMGFCLNCHKARNAPLDCSACHR